MRERTDLLKRVYEAWGNETSKTLVAAERVPGDRANGTIEADAQLLWRIEAATWEEAMAIHNLRMGFGPYKPMGDPAPCPTCGSSFYPKGSGECWRCGKVV